MGKDGVKVKATVQKQEQPVVKKRREMRGAGSSHDWI